MKQWTEPLQQRIDAQKEWLLKWAPECFQEQKHTDADINGKPCAERIYWHYGYMIALRDVIALLTSDGGEP